MVLLSLFLFLSLSLFHPSISSSDHPFSPFHYAFRFFLILHPYSSSISSTFPPFSPLLPSPPSLQYVSSNTPKSHSAHISHAAPYSTLLPLSFLPSFPHSLPPLFPLPAVASTSFTYSPSFPHSPLPLPLSLSLIFTPTTCSSSIISTVENHIADGRMYRAYNPPLTVFNPILRYLLGVRLKRNIFKNPVCEICFDKYLLPK